MQNEIPVDQATVCKGALKPYRSLPGQYIQATPARSNLDASAALKHKMMID